MKYEDQDPTQPGKVKTGCLPWLCILAGCPEGGTVLDPFTGSGTTGVVACTRGRNFVGCEINPEYADMARNRIGKAIRPETHRSNAIIDSPLFSKASP